jgi:hypothetical protein
MIPAKTRHSTKTPPAVPRSEAENQAMFAAEQEIKDRAEERAAAPTEASFPTDRRAGMGASRSNVDKRTR